MSPIEITSSYLPGGELDLGASATFKFNVTIPTFANVLMDESNITVQSLTVNSGGTLTANSSLDSRTDLVNHGLIYNLGGTIEGNLINDGTSAVAGAFIANNLTIRGSLLNSGQATWSDGVLTGATFANSGTFSIEPAGTQSQEGKIFEGTLNNTGTVTMTDQMGLWAATINNEAGGLFDIQSNSGFGAYNNGPWVINNAGLWRKSAGSGTSSVDGNIAFNNTGTVEVDSGVMQFNGGGSNSAGQFVFGNGGEARFGSGTFNFTGTSSANGSGSVEVSGGFVRAANGMSATFANFTNGANLVVDGGQIGGDTGGTMTFDLTGSSSLMLTNASNGYGTVGGLGTTINAGNFQWLDGSIAGTGLNNTGSLSIEPAGTQWQEGKIFEGTLNNTGTVTMTDQMGLWAATINNEAGGLFDVQSNSGFGAYNNGPWVINNAGLWRKSAGSGTSSVDGNIAFNNTGTVEVDSGVMQFNGGGSNSTGQFVFGNGGEARFGGGTFNFTGTNSASGNGSVEVSGGFVRAANGMSATFANFTNGANLVVDGGQIGGDSGGTMTFDLTGSSSVKLTNANNGYGTVGGLGTTINDGNFQWFDGGIEGLNNTGSLSIEPAGTQWQEGKIFEGTLNNSGTVTMTDQMGLWAATINNEAGGLFDIQSNSGFGAYNNGPWVINNAGLWRKSAGSGTSSVDGNIAFNNTGTVEVDSGVMQFNGPISQLSNNILTGGTWSVANNATLSLPGYITNNQGTVMMSGTNSTFTAINMLGNNQGSFGIFDGRAFITSGDLQNSGLLTVGQGSNLKVSGNLSLLDGGSLTLKIGGLQEATDDGTVTVGGSASLGGALVLSFANGFENQVLGSETFTLITATDPITGDFTDVANGARLEAADGLGSFIVNYGPSSPYGANTVVLSQPEGVPEPNASMFILFGGAVLSCCFGRRKSAAPIIRNDGPKQKRFAFRSKKVLLL